MKPANLSARARRNLWIAGIALLLFTVTGFFILPPIVKSQLEKRLSAEFGRTVTVGKVRMNPYALSLTLENFDIRLKEGNGSFLGWDRLYVNFDALASLTGDWVLGEIELDGFHVGVILKPDGSLNFSDILAKLTAASPTPAKAPAKPARPIRIGSLKVTQARVEFADQARKLPFRTVAGPVTFALTEFRTAGSRGAPYHFEAVTESGEKLAWTGTISAEPFRSVGELSLANIALAKYAPYYADQMQADLADGKLSVRGRYEVNLTEGQRVLKLIDGALQLRGLKLLERTSQETAVELPALDITGVNADALAQKATVGSVAVAGGHLRVRREKDGSINLLTMLQPSVGDSASPAPAVTPAAPAKLPDVTIGEVALKDFQVDLSDLAAPRPAQLGLSGLQFSLKNFSLAAGASMPLQLSLTWAPQGTVRVEGSVALKPEVKADLKLDVVGLELLPLSPYLEQFVNARITQGAVTTALTAQVALPAGQPPAATLAGDVKVEKFGLVDSAHNDELAGFGALALNGLKVATAAQLSVTLTEVNIAAPYARVIRNSDLSLNLATIARVNSPPATATPGSVPAPVVPAAPAPQIEIGQVNISEGEFSLTDHSLQPEVRMALNKFNGTITGLSSQTPGRGEAQLHALVDNVGPVAITGKINPLGANLYLDAKLDFKGVDLQPISPYLGKYAGYELARGKLSLDITARLADRQVDMTNLITLNQFTFGAATNSPDATGLPVRLGVALLKDTDGKIIIDVPVQGNLNDPSFRIGAVVVRVIVNLLTKAAISPFSLLGSMFGGGGDELGYQEFLPGEAIAIPGNEKKLETVAKALTARPALNLDIEGGYDPAADGYVLKRKKLAASLRHQIWEEKHLRDPNIPPPEKLEVSAEEYAARLKQAFDEKYPPGTVFGAPLSPRPEVLPPPPPPPAGIFKRIINTVTFKDSREKNAQKKAQQGAHEKYQEVAKLTEAAGLPFEEMVGRLAETVALTPDDFRALADARAQSVRDHLINEGKISLDRLFLTKPAAVPAAGAAEPAAPTQGPRVLLHLQ